MTATHHQFRKNIFKLFTILVLFYAGSSFAQNTAWMNLDTVKAQKFDTGKMWTFENFPFKYIQSAYDFTPSQDWLDNVRMSALRFASWCSSSFVSEDGLVMTNHHCVDFITEGVQKEGENIPRDGFYAPTLKDERPIPNVYVDQLVLIEDVTDQIVPKINEGKTDAEKVENKLNAIKEVEKKYSDETGLICKVTSLYNGGRFSLYGYKRYNDVRLVYVNERNVGLYGGDPDNFTYPRYNADFAFCRVYDESGKPLKTDHFFKFSQNGASDDELIFVIGNPGSTQRLKTVAQLEYYRDVTYRNNAFILEGMFKIYDDLIAEFPDKAAEYEGTQFFVGNSRKVVDGVLGGLRDPYFMARKKSFENNFKNAIMSKPELKAKFGHLWDAIEGTRSEMRKIAFENSAFNLAPNSRPQYFKMAEDMIELANQLKLPEESREPKYKTDKLNETIEGIFPKNFDGAFQPKLLALVADYLYLNLGDDNAMLKKMFGGLKGKEAAEYALKNSMLTSKENVIKLAGEGSDKILGGSDPFIYFIMQTKDKAMELAKQVKEINTTEQALDDQMGQALFAVYGTSIPPDATFTLRISDGVMKSYHYNGTVAPTFTTFYGMYDRYNSFRKKYPWALPERWTKLNPDFDLATPYNFISTHDIVGGSSGSAVINTKGEIVGIAFDGNIESIPGNFLYSTEANRMVSVASQGILEILGDLLHVKRIAEELKLGRIPDEYKGN